MSPAVSMSFRSIDELGDDLRVVRRVRRRRRRGLDAQQRLATADRVELAAAPQFLGDRHRVDRFALAVQRERGVVDRAVRGLVEVARFDVRFDRGRERLAATASSPRAATPRPRGCAAGCARPRPAGGRRCSRGSIVCTNELVPSPQRRGWHLDPVGWKRNNPVSFLWTTLTRIHSHVDCRGRVRRFRGWRGLITRPQGMWERLWTAARYPLRRGAVPDHQRAAVHQRREAPGQPGRVDAAGRRLRPLPAPAGRGGAVHLRHRRARHPGRAGRQGGRPRRSPSSAGSSTRCSGTSASGSG